MPVPAADAGAPPPADVDRILDAVARLQWDDTPADPTPGTGALWESACLTSCCPTSARASTRPRSSPGTSRWATTWPSTRSSSRSRRPRRWSTSRCPFAGVVVRAARPAGADGRRRVAAGERGRGRPADRRCRRQPRNVLVGRYGAAAVPRRRPGRGRHGRRPRRAAAAAAPAPRSSRLRRAGGGPVRGDLPARPAAGPRGRARPAAAGGHAAPAGSCAAQDVEAALQLPGRRRPAPAGSARTSTTGHRIPLRGVRRAVADKLSRSRAARSPRRPCWVDVDATELLAARAALNARQPERPRQPAGAARPVHPARPAPLPRAQRHGSRPTRSSSLERVHLGFAAQTDRGLVVPVVRDAHRLTTRDRSARARPAHRGRPGPARSTPAELTGGTFTVNNYGVFGVDGSAADHQPPRGGDRSASAGSSTGRGWSTGSSPSARSASSRSPSTTGSATAARPGASCGTWPTASRRPLLALGDL